MGDPYYPQVDIEFLLDKIRQSNKLEPGGEMRIGSTFLFILKGTSAIHKRQVWVRVINGNQVSFELATSVAIRLKFMGSLLSWLKDNRGWNEGDYCL